MKKTLALLLMAGLMMSPLAATQVFADAGARAPHSFSKSHSKTKKAPKKAPKKHRVSKPAPQKAVHK